MKTKEEVREQILDAAWKRFSHYGYGKTTMAEIARDCGMSAANLYRYFKDKSAIGAGIAKRYFDKEARLIAEVVDRTGLTAAEKLEELVMASVRYNFAEFEDSPEIMELVNHICTDGADLIEDHRDQNMSAIVRILEEGNRTGEFDVKDASETAEAIRVATIPFHVTPVFLMLKGFGCDCLNMGEMVKSVMNLIINGIARR